MSHRDGEDEWTGAINEAHPTRSGSHKQWDIAMQMVGNRHSKGELVELVNWLLVKDAAAEAKNKNQAHEITSLITSAKTRNVQLDALHFVWCSGGCDSGVHRFTEDALTADHVREAVRNTMRLVTKWVNLRGKEDPSYPAGYKEAFDRAHEQLLGREAAETRAARLATLGKALVDAHASGDGNATLGALDALRAALAEETGR